MKKPFEAEKSKFTKDLDGLSLKMLENHFKLYEGYVKKTNEIQEKLESADKAEANGTYSLFGELKRQETFAVNGMKLHEVYFGHLSGDGVPKGELADMIAEDFGSVENWKADIIAAGICARGWAILAFDLKDGRLHNYGADTHNMGAVWGAIPLVALDVYEHAYFIDYAIDRKSYINAFFKNLDWNFANEIIKKYELAKYRTA
jgi:Fe-Mn family superoxide dismutase